MRADALAVGAILLIMGLGLAIWGFDQADHVYPRWENMEKYNSYTGAGFLGLILGAIGAGLALYGIASNPSQPVQRPTAGIGSQGGYGLYYTVQPGQSLFCQYCGRPLAPDAVYCPGCGRSSQK